MARTTTTAFQPTAEQAAGFGPPHEFPIHFSNSQGSDFVFRHGRATSRLGPKPLRRERRPQADDRDIPLIWNETAVSIDPFVHKVNRNIFVIGLGSPTVAVTVQQCGGTSLRRDENLPVHGGALSRVPIGRHRDAEPADRHGSSAEDVASTSTTKVFCQSISAPDPRQVGRQRSHCSPPDAPAKKQGRLPGPIL